MNRVLGGQIVGPLLALVVIVAIVSLTTDRFLDWGNLSNLALQVSVVSIVAIGATIVILTGGIDLSPGSAIAFLTLLLAILIKTMGVPLPIAVALVILAGAGLGAINGVIVAYLRVPSFIATLAAFSGYRGLAFMLTEGAPVVSVSPDLSNIFYGTFLGLPLPFFYVVVAFAGFAIFLNHTPTGRRFYAVGGNAHAARLSGIRISTIHLSAFVLAGICYGAGAVLFAARLNSGSANYGSGMELQAIAASVIGGASLSGGRGNVLGTLIGALIITIVQNAMNLNGVQSAVQAIVVGLIILLAVGLDMWRPEVSRIFGRALGHTA
jgi:ribose transport system permease protein